MDSSSSPRKLPTSTSTRTTAVVDRIDRYHQKQANWDADNNVTPSTRPINLAPEEAQVERKDKKDGIPLNDKQLDEKGSTFTQNRIVPTAITISSSTVQDRIDRHRQKQNNWDADNNNTPAHSVPTTSTQVATETLRKMESVDADIKVASSETPLRRKQIKRSRKQKGGPVDEDRNNTSTRSLLSSLVSIVRKRLRRAKRRSNGTTGMEYNRWSRRTRRRQTVQEEEEKKEEEAEEFDSEEVVPGALAISYENDNESGGRNPRVDLRTKGALTQLDSESLRELTTNNVQGDINNAESNLNQVEAINDIAVVEKMDLPIEEKDTLSTFCTCLFIIVGVGVVAIIVTFATMLIQIPSPRYDVVWNVLEPHVQRHEEPLSQHQLDAINWLANDDAYSFEEKNVLAIEANELIERYALVVLYFSTGWELSYLSEELSYCNWNDGATIGVFCGSNTKVTVDKIISDNSNLSGPIPREIALLSNLKHLSLATNQLTGTIPPEIGDLRFLTNLSLNSNYLNGKIPAEIGDLSRLKYLDLNNATLFGPIPREIALLSNLKHLSLATNELRGAIPPEIGDLKFLTNLSLNSNYLSGTIPAEIGNLLGLKFVDLNSNTLSGTIPTDIGMLFRLEFLDLNSNNLSGFIPTELAMLTRLEYLDLRSNNLSGTITTDTSFPGSPSFPVMLLFVGGYARGGGLENNLAEDEQALAP